MENKKRLNKCLKKNSIKMYNVCQNKSLDNIYNKKQKDFFQMIKTYDFIYF